MPRLLSNRKPVPRPENLKPDRWDYLAVDNAQPALGVAPESNTGYTLQTDDSGKATFTNTLGKLSFTSQVIKSTLNGTEIEINGVDSNSNIILTPFQKVQIAGDVDIEQDLAVTGDGSVTGDFTVSGIPLGTFPINPLTLYVTPNGNDNNDGSALDSTRACRTISGAVRSPLYTEGTTIKVAAGTYFEDNPIPLKAYTSVVGNDLRTTFVEPLNKDLDLFHVNSGIYIAQMQMRNLRRGNVERYAPGGQGTYTTGAYMCAFPPNLENPIDLYHSPYIQNCTNQSGPWLKDGTMFNPNQTIQIPLAAGTSTWTADQNQIVVSVYTGTISVGMAVNDAANEGYRNAQLLLEKNRIFLQTQAVAFVEDQFPDLVYNQVKCYRDVGYIVDAVAGDARFGGNKRSIEAGLAYWSGNTSLISGEQFQTIAAINYIRDLSVDIIVNNTVTNLFDTSTFQVINLNLDNGQVVNTRIIESFNLISSIIQSGESSVPNPKEDLYGLIYPTGLSPNGVNNASTITAITTVSDNVYLITLSSPTVSPSDNATIYFGETSVYPFLDADIPTAWTVNDGDKYADRRLDPIGSGGGALVDGNAPSIRSPIQSFVFDAFTQVTQGGIGVHIINNGYAQLVSVFTIMCSQAVIVENGGIASITNSNANFGDTCLTAKGLGKLAFAGFVRNPAYPTNVPNSDFYPLGFWPNKQRMEVFIPNDRDRPHIGQVMEVVAPDTYIDYNGDRVPYVNSAGYPGYLIATINTNTIVTNSYTINDIDVTDVAVGHTLYVTDVFGNSVNPDTGIPYITTGTQVIDVNFRSITLDRPIVSGYQDLNYDAFFNLYFCGNAYYTVLSSIVDESLSSTVTNQVTLVPGQETTTSLAVSYAKNLALRVIQNEPVAGLVYNQAKCKRDTGLIIDSIAVDLLYPTTELSQSNFSGLQYWNQDQYIGTIANELTTTTNAIRYVKQLAQEIVQNITGSVSSGTRYQSTVTQNISPPPASIVAATIVGNDFEVILDIIVDGVAGVTDKIIPNGEISGTEERTKAYNLLLGNKTYIQEEAIAYVETTKTSGFTYDAGLCYRDVGYMIDSVAFDLLHPYGDVSSNRQAIQSGVSYYGYNSSSTAIANEIPATTAAYNYIRQLIPYVVQGITTSTYQTFVPQITNISTATITEVTKLQDSIDLIVDIINNGPDAANAKVPVSLTESLIPEDYNAYLALQANRSFIQEEVIAYINSTNDLGTYQTAYSQIFDPTLTGGIDAVGSLGSKFDIIANIIKDGSTSSPEITRPRQYVDPNINILNAKKLLDKNRRFIQEETVAFVDDLWPSKFSYDPAKCSRDTGLIVDSLAQDLLFQGTSQSTFAGLQYWNQNASVIPGEETTTTRAISYLKSLAQQVVRNNTSGYRYQSTVTQVTSTITSSTSIVAANVGKDFDVILTILENGTEGVTDIIVPNGITASTSTSTISAYTLLQANKEYLQHEVVAYVDQTSNFVYDQAKCLRDTGLIVDSIAFDLLYPSTNDSQSTFAGIQYWNQNSYVGNIANEITTTTNAIIYLSSLAQKVVVNNQSGTRYQSTVTQTTSTLVATSNESAVIGNNFGFIIDILNTGTNGVTDIIVPNGKRRSSTNTNYAYTLLLSNKEYLIAEVIAYVETTKTSGFTYDSAKCQRDAGYMIDSVAFDLLHGGNKQSVQSGVLYYGYISTSTAILNEIPQTTAAYNRLKDILGNIIGGVEIIPSAGNTTNQITYMLPANSTTITKAKAKVDKITNIINNGPAIAGTLTSISLTASSDINSTYAFDLLLANRTFIQDEIVSYINSNFTGFVYDKEKCFRDIGYMIDSVSVDLLYGGNKQAVQSGVYYYGYNGEDTAIPKEIPQTTSAYNFIESIVENIVTGTLITGPQQTLITQVISTQTGTTVEAQIVKNNVNLINNIIERGPDEVTVKESISVTASTSTSTVNAVKLLNANRDFIRAETIAYINNTYNTGFLYDKTKCKRDTGLIIDSIAFDLLYEGTTESTFAGLQYWNQDAYTGEIISQLTTTTNAIRYIKELVGKVIVNEPVDATTSTSQVLNLSTGTVKISQTVQNNVDLILSILTGGTTGVTDLIVPNGVVSTSTNILASYDILRANKAFIQDEVIARIDLDNQEFSYDREICYRDVGYIVDSLSFDLLHGGNRQSITSGVYYYGFNAADTAIDDQIPQTTAAYDYIKTIVSNIITGTSLDNTYQFKVPQVLSASTGTSIEVSLVQDKIDNITNIINNGPGVAPAKQPISQVASTSTQVINAFDLLLANRDFIKAEVIAYIDTAFTDAPNYPKDKCYRDVGAIIDAVGYDLIYGGNYNSVNTGNGYFNRKGQYHIVRLEQNVTDPTLFIDGATVRFYQQSYISASGYLFEYVGAGTQYGALPQVGTADPQQNKEVVQLNNGKVFFTSTDQNGDFRIGPTLVISQSTGVLAGRTFEKSLYATMTPFILVVGA
jgi:hypothetical protein